MNNKDSNFKNNLDKGKVDNLFNSLGTEDKNKINALLSDKEKLEKILNSDKAREIIKKLGLENKNG